MKLIKEIRDNVAILTLKGDFDSFVCKPFIEQVNAIHGDDIHNFVIDLRLILFVNSTGIGTLIKAHKEAKAQGGTLVLSRPSKFVTGVIETLGLDKLFSIYEDPDKAASELGCTGDGTDLGGDASVIVNIPGKDKCVGKMAALEEDGMTLTLPAANVDLPVGSDIKLKFRLPLFMKSHYFDAGATVVEAIRSGESLKIKCSFTNMDDENRSSISQFVQEMKFLREEARKDQ